MKIKYRIPSKDPFGFVEMEYETTTKDKEMDLAKVVDQLEEVMAHQKGEKAGLPPKDWCAWLDTYLTTNTGNADQYNLMSPEQVRVIQEIKKAVKRLKAKTDPEIE